MIELIIGAAVAMVAQIAKKYELDQKYVVLIISLIAGFVWHMIGEAGQYFVAETRLSIVGSATLVYNIYKIYEQNK